MGFHKLTQKVVTKNPLPGDPACIFVRERAEWPGIPVDYHNRGNTMKRYEKISLSVLVAAIIGTACYLQYKERPIDNPAPNLIVRSGDAATSGEFKNAQNAVGFYRDEIRSKPAVVKNYVELAQIFLQEARATGLHHEYVQKAEWLLTEALQREPENFEALLARSSICMIKHQFQQAREIAEKAIAKNPYNALSYGILCDALVELGEYDEAVRAGDRMLSIRPDLRSYARASYLREIHGDLPGAKAAMQMAGESGVYGQENRAWAFYNLGKLYLNEGRLDTAEFIFNGILEERPGYGYALSGLASVRYAQGRTEESISLLKTAFEKMPEHLFVEQLADIYRVIGDRENTEAATKIVFSEFEEHADAGWDVDKEFALFCANHELNLSEALKRARSEYERRPKNIEALDAYAWTLFKNGMAMEAVPYIEQALRMKTQNASLLYHAGAIFHAAGMRDKAASLLEKSLRLNSTGNVLYTKDARVTLASLKG